MRTHTLIIAAAVAFLVGGVVAGEVEETFGLSGSVFDTPDPVVPMDAAGEPGENQKLGGYSEGMPPLISHQTTDQLPITLKENLCLDCHHLPAEIGTEIAAEDATPVPVSHYTDLRKPGSKATQELIGARYVCTQCHAAQTDAAPLVASTY